MPGSDFVAIKSSATLLASPQALFEVLTPGDIDIVRQVGGGKTGWQRACVFFSVADLGVAVNVFGVAVNVRCCCRCFRCCGTVSVPDQPAAVT